ncbi:hypothetical protein A2Z33_06315 [Candidatus Gottesmanbacteria bacterium RBG_16_52_11]|uniref:Bacterial Ig domain-containing protein n=1 Tax=Candidatus Gottesmanbacteria bacterium RBG_16_52_11 TaxID=1798374 RepID=A0A1F5YY46_9BACT|nr:MAG: hypothetical protein A2Z33_06315 [Candidatus Gottesmanbacteria bacterium RBG_16_52_11]
MFLALNTAGATTAVNGEILVSGRTLPNATVLIYTDADETSIESSGDGQFESTVIVGENGGLVRVTAFSDAGEETSETISVAPETGQ